MKILKFLLIVMLLFSIGLYGNAYTLTQVKLGDIQYTGTSVETKPTTNVARGTLFYETDTLRQYVYDGSDWNLFGGIGTFDITEYPVDGQGTSDGVQWSTPISTEAAGEDKAILSYGSYTNYPNYMGNLIRVHYTINLELKAANATADVIWQLQAKDKDETTWLDMSAATTETDIGTSYVSKVVKGYMDIQADADEIPFEMQLILKSNESDVDITVSCTWADAGNLGAATYVYGMVEFDSKIYAGTGMSVGRVYNSSGGGWTEETCTATSDVFGLAVYNSKLYAATGGKVFLESGGSWSAIGASPGDNRSILVMDAGDGEKLYVGIEDNSCYSFNGTDWVNTNLASGSGGKVVCLANLDGVLYAGAENGTVWKYLGTPGTGWTQTGTLSSVTKVYALAVLNGVLYAGTTPSGKVFKFNGETPGAWTATTGDPASANNTLALFVHDGVLYAGTDASAPVFYYDEVAGTWTVASDLSSAFSALCFAAFDGDLYCGTRTNGDVFKATVTQESGEGTGRIKNDTVINIVGRFY